MIRPPSGLPVYLYTGPVDMCKSINGLAILVEQEMALSPFDPVALKALLLQQKSAYQEQIILLQEQLYIMKYHRFGASSEKQSVDQLGLFNEA